MTYRAWNTKTVDRAALKELTAAIAQQNTEELEYQNMDEEWSEEKYRSVLAAQQKEVGLLAGILAARGITDPAEALTLLAGEEELSDPLLLTDMDKACAGHRRRGDHRRLRRLRRGRCDRHGPALSAPERDGRRRQVYAAQPGGRRLRPLEERHPVDLR